MTEFKQWVVFICAVVFVLSFVLATDSMTTCQETHSFDTCHYALNR